MKTKTNSVLMADDANQDLKDGTLIFFGVFAGIAIGPACVGIIILICR